MSGYFPTAKTSFSKAVGAPTDAMFCFLLLLSALLPSRFVLAACPAAPLPPALAAVPKISYEITGRLPHDPAAFTQGLLFADGLLYESTGRYGASSLRMIDAGSGAILKHRDLPATVFGEGLALFDGKLIQLTWKEHAAFVHDASDFALLQTFTFAGEGWGLTADASLLYMSDGSSTISVRSPVDFTEKRRISVHAGKYPVAGINELPGRVEIDLKDARAGRFVLRPA